MLLLIALGQHIAEVLGHAFVFSGSRHSAVAGAVVSLPVLGKHMPPGLCFEIGCHDLLIAVGSSLVCISITKFACAAVQYLALSVCMLSFGNFARGTCCFIFLTYHKHGGFSAAESCEGVQICHAMHRFMDI